MPRELTDLAACTDEKIRHCLRIGIGFTFEGSPRRFRRLDHSHGAVAGDRVEEVWCERLAGTLQRRVARAHAQPLHASWMLRENDRRFHVGEVAARVDVGGALQCHQRIVCQPTVERRLERGAESTYEPGASGLHDKIVGDRVAIDGAGNGVGERVITDVRVRVFAASGETDFS